MASKKNDCVIAYADMLRQLEARHPKKEWAFLQQVRNSTGYQRTIRTADFLALSLWPSRGLSLHGFEAKQSRGDWKREKDAPEKAEEIAQYCDFWWLVVTSASIAPLSELPETWGLLAPDDQGKLAIYRQATKLEAKPIPRSFLAAILRNASDGMEPAATVESRVQEARRDGIAIGERTVADITELNRLRKYETAVNDFEHETGLHLDFAGIYGGATAKAIGEAVRVLLKADQELEWRLTSLKHLAREAAELKRFVDEQTETIKTAAAKIRISASAAS